MTPDIQPDEQVLYSRRMSIIGVLTHPKAIWTLWILALPMYLGSRYIITDQRAYRRNGLVSRTVEEIDTSQIQNAEVSQGILSRLTGFGTVQIHGKGGKAVTFHRTRRPKKAYKTVQNAKRNAD